MKILDLKQAAAFLKMSPRALRKKLQMAKYLVQSLGNAGALEKMILQITSDRFMLLLLKHRGVSTTKGGINGTLQTK